MLKRAFTISIALGAAALLANACQGDFKNCEETNSCAAAGGTPGGSGSASSGGINAGGMGEGGSGAMGGSGATGGTLPCDGDCKGDTPECDEDADKCVECLEEKHCDDDATPTCDTDEGKCVECVASSDCDGDSDASVCDEDAQECIECLKDGDCSGETALCDTEAQECVGCLVTTDCEKANASVCREGACGGCLDAEGCSHIEGKNACDTDADTCVKCINSSDCGGKVCDLSTHTCSAYAEDRLPCESCDSDQNCETVDHFCVPMKYEGADREGGYCLKKMPDCFEPFASPISGRTSLSGVDGQSYCGINEARATCEAVRALRDDVQCPGGQDSECPESGQCESLGGILTNRCTYQCGLASQCLSSAPANTCGPSPNDYCGYLP